MNIYLICGYGVPPDGRETENYTTYLNVAFNYLFEHSAGKEAVVMVSGGPTNCTAPYEGTEAEHMGEWMQKRFLRAPEATEKWRIVLEDRALSSPENLIFAKELMDEHGLLGEVTVICEFLRERKMRAYTRAVFGDSAQVYAIDFDTSPNRYESRDRVEALLDQQIAADLPIINNPELRAAHHAFYEQKLAMLRKWQDEGMTHSAAVKRWWDEYGGAR